MRGFSSDRYRANDTLSVSAEWRHKFTERWGMVAYAEAGRFAPSLHQLADGRTIKTFGSGVRWRVTAERDMNVGVDYAVSSDDRAGVHPDRRAVLTMRLGLPCEERP